MNSPQESLELPDLAPLERYRPILDDWEGFMETLRRPLPTCVWANSLKTAPEHLKTQLEAKGFAPRALPWFSGAFILPEAPSPGTTIAFRAGHYHVQEEVSLLPVRLLEPQPGERVLDLCAAPGNKTAQIAAAMQNRGTVIANDRSGGRMRALRGTLDRLGAANVSTTIYDAASYPPEAGRFDRVLVDVSCSCEGTSRKHPGILENLGTDDSFDQTGLQTAILRKAVQLCRPGGRIVYSTCTYAPEENEAVVDTVLREHPEALQLLPARLPGFTVSEGLTSWRRRDFSSDLRRALRVWPHQNDTGGFFVAVLEKKGEVEERKKGGANALHRHAEVVDPEPWLEPLEEHFGFLEDTFDGFVLVKPNKKKLYLLPDDHDLPERPVPHSIGLAFLRIKMADPKLSTAAAMLFGNRATRNVIDASEEQAQAYLRRKDLQLTSEQAARCTGKGYVLVRHEGMALGVAFYRPDAGTVRSMYPKAWALS